MKLLLAIVSNEDSAAVGRALTKNGFQVTKLATTGGFLSQGNTTLIIGLEDELVDKAVELIGSESKTRKEFAPTSTMYGTDRIITAPVEVTVGGATIFVLNVDQFIKL